MTAPTARFAISTQSSPETTYLCHVAFNGLKNRTVDSNVTVTVVALDIFRYDFSEDLEVGSCASIDLVIPKAVLV